MNRFHFVLAASVAPNEIPLLVLAKELARAVEQTEGEGYIATEDPAVLILGAYVAFATHADVNTYKGYTQLLSLCESRAANPLPLQ